MKSKAILVLAVILAVYFGLNGLLKLAGNPHMVESFARWGYGHTFLLMIGATELAAGAALPFRATSRVAGFVLAAVMVGAIYTHVTHAEWTHALIPLVMFPLVLLVSGARSGAPLGRAFRFRTSEKELSPDSPAKRP